MGVWGGGGGRLRRIFPERKKKDVRLNKNVPAWWSARVVQEEREAYSSNSRIAPAAPPGYHPTMIRTETVGQTSCLWGEAPINCGLILSCSHEHIFLDSWLKFLILRQQPY